MLAASLLLQSIFALWIDNEFPCQLMHQGQQLLQLISRPCKCFVGKVQIHLRHSQHKLKHQHWPALSIQRALNQWHSMVFIVVVINKMQIFEMKVVWFSILKLNHLTTIQHVWVQSVIGIKQSWCCPCNLCHVTHIFHSPNIIPDYIQVSLNCHNTNNLLLNWFLIVSPATNDGQ